MQRVRDKLDVGRPLCADDVIEEAIPSSAQSSFCSTMRMKVETSPQSYSRSVCLLNRLLLTSGQLGKGDAPQPSVKCKVVRRVHTGPLGHHL